MVVDERHLLGQARVRGGIHLKFEGGNGENGGVGGGDDDEKDLQVVPWS